PPAASSAETLPRAQAEASNDTGPGPAPAAARESAFQKVERFVSWGRVIRAPHLVARPTFRDELPPLVDALSAADPRLAVGLRRSYGDSNLNPEHRVTDMTALDRMIALDPATGLLRAEAGASLSQCIQVLVPQGWFLPTTPGTRFV